MDASIGNSSQFRTTVKTYLDLMKLRIVTLLVFTTVTAMMIAAEGRPSIDILLATILGGILASGGSSAINQYLDRDMDALMARTSRRPIPSGRIVPINALIFGVSLIIWSIVILSVFVNPLSALLAFMGSIYYVVLYTMILKRNTVVNILIGGGAGAFPVLVGWAAVTGEIGYEAGILFAIVFWWTPPHSWALALVVNKDYATANVPMMPVARGEQTTRIQIVLYSVQLMVISILPVFFEMLDAIYLLAALTLGAGLVWMAVQLLQKPSQALARSTFKYSTAYLAFLFMAMILDRLLIPLL